jgi:hypothetical protein
VKETIDKLARRTLQKYRLHLNGWSLPQDQVSQQINGTLSDTPATDDPLAITSDAVLPAAVIGSPYVEVDLVVTGGTGPYTWTVVAGAFLTGISMDSAGAITGTATVGGVANVTVRVTDSKNALTQKALFLTSEVPVITTGSLANGTVAVPYAEALDATGGTAPYTWALSDGAPPPGLDVRSAGGITGTPSFYGSFSFSVQVTDDWGVSSQGSFGIIIGI